MCVELGVARRTLTAGKEGTSTAAPLCYSFLLATLACNKLQLTLASSGTSGSSQECHELPPPPSPPLSPPIQAQRFALSFTHMHYPPSQISPLCFPRLAPFDSLGSVAVISLGPICCNLYI